MLDIVEQFLSNRSSHNSVTHGFRNTYERKQKTLSQPVGIAYDPSLIKDLELEHEVLIENFVSTLKGFESGDLELLCHKLNDFKTLFQQHIVKENVKLFGYLERSAKNDFDTLNIMREVRKDMHACSNTVINFCKKFEQPLDVFVCRESFESEFRSVAKTLMHRVQIVETEVYRRYLIS